MNAQPTGSRDLLEAHAAGLCYLSSILPFQEQQRRMRRKALVFVLVLACSRTDKVATTASAQAPAAAAPAPAPPAPASEIDRAKNLLGETLQRHGGYLAMAKNIKDH